MRKIFSEEKNFFAKNAPKILHGTTFSLRVVVKSIIKFHCFDLLCCDYFEMNVFFSYCTFIVSVTLSALLAVDTLQ